jgi:hypothetical protein
MGYGDIVPARISGNDTQTGLAGHDKGFTNWPLMPPRPLARLARLALPDHQVALPACLVEEFSV